MRETKITAKSFPAGVWECESSETKKWLTDEMVEGVINKVSTLNGIKVAYSEEYRTSESDPQKIVITKVSCVVEGIDLVASSAQGDEQDATDVLAAIPVALCHLDYDDLDLLVH